MTGKLEDLACKSCGVRWSDENGDGWFFKFARNPDPKKNRLLWVKCPACLSERGRFAMGAAGDIARLTKG